MLISSVVLSSIFLHLCTEKFSRNFTGPSVAIRTKPVQLKKMERDPMEMALSTDIIMDVVLSYLQAGDLLSCRLASKFWSKAASAVLRKRWTMIKTIYKEGDVMKLEECMKRSSDFPFTGLKFYGPYEFNAGRAVEFFKNSGDRFTRLRLDTYWTRRLHGLATFIDRLPRLSILELGQPDSLFLNLLDDDIDQEDDKLLKLPSIRILRLSLLENEEVLREVLAAVSPSVQIECLNVNPIIVRGLQSAGQLRAVSVMKFDSEHDSNRDRGRAEMDQLLSTGSPSLTKLDFHGRGFLSLAGLDQILFSSQHTLKELHLDGSLWLSEYSWENFPVLTKLTKLSLKVSNNFCYGSLFRGRHGYKFPALKELHLRLAYYIQNGHVGPGYSSSLFVVPSVTRLELVGFVNEDGMEQLAQSFPNVIDMQLDYGCYVDPFKIWSVGDFKCLEKLRIWNFTIEQPSKDYVNMDSFLTGIPVVICENLRKRKRVDLINSPFNEILRNNPSILQLKNLKELIICVKPGDEFGEVGEDVPFMSMVSLWYALEMMPNLRAKFLVERRAYDCSFYEECDKEVIEDAFKHVQPYVKPERFYY